MRLLLIFLGVGLVVFVVSRLSSPSAQGCSGYRHATPDEVVGFSEKIVAIRRRVVDLTSRDDLFGIDSFVAIYEEPSKHFSEALASLKSPRLNSLEKEIVVYSMTMLNEECYLVLVKECYSAYQMGLMSGEEFGRSVKHDFGKRRSFDEVAHNGRAAKLIKIMLSDTSLPRSIRLYLGRLTPGLSH